MSKGKFIQVVDGGQYRVIAERDGETVTFTAWQGARTLTGYATEREIDGRVFGKLGTYDTGAYGANYGAKLAEYQLAYTLIARVFDGIRFSLVGRFAWGTIEVRYLTEQRAKLVTGEI